MLLMSFKNGGLQPSVDDNPSQKRSPFARAWLRTMRSHVRIMPGRPIRKLIGSGSSREEPLSAFGEFSVVGPQLAPSREIWGNEILLKFHLL